MENLMGFMSGNIGIAPSSLCLSSSRIHCKNRRIPASGKAFCLSNLDQTGENSGNTVNNEGSHMIVIVGAGIAGLSAAVAFQRLGVQTLVLEKANSLRAGGTSLTLWRNAWRALDVLGVGDELRKECFLLTGSKVVSPEGEITQKTSFGRCSQGGLNEVRAVERAAVLEALAKCLPAGTIRFNSNVVGVKKSSSYNNIVLDDGSVISTKVLVGCDGVRSEVAKFLGLREPSFVGQCAIRGLADFPTGHNYEPLLLQFVGGGIRAGVVPISSTKLYWFVCFKSSSAAARRIKPELLKEEALGLLKNWSEKNVEEFANIIKNTPDHTLSRSSLCHRWPLPFMSRALSADGVALAGDALHPMTPNLGQGGCLALEDGVVLARELYNHRVFAGMNSDEMNNNINSALHAYTRGRCSRFIPLTLKSFLIGFVYLIEFGPAVHFRDLFGKFALQPQRFLAHTLYDCGELPNSNRILLPVELHISLD